MPIMSPEVQKLMRAAGLTDRDKNESTSEDSIGSKLERAGLGLDDVLLNLAQTANNSANEGLKVRANETALKLHGALKETAAAPASNFTIIINDPTYSPAKSLEGVNPIFLPRQLLSQLPKESDETN